MTAFRGPVAPVKVRFTYKLALFFTAIAMILLPLVYLSLIALVCYATYWHAVENTTLLEAHIGRKVALFLYATPLVAGATMVFFMIKPLFAPRGAEPRRRSLRRQDEPLLYAFVEKLCATVGAPVPGRIDVDCEVNASASLRRGFRSLFGRQDLVLTIGLPLVDGLRLDQLAGVLAHEFGHFAQGAGMRLSYVVRSTNHWFARVVYGRDRWDRELEAASKNDSGWLTAVVGIARGAVWASRKVLAGLMHLGHAISCYLMRQMEFDADRYEARLVGSDVFTSTCHEMSYLGVAFRRSLDDVSLSWRDGHLADSLPRMVAHHRGQMDQKLLRGIAQEIGQTETAWSDTHPSDRERLASARREEGAAAFCSSLPAAVLFREFPRLSREVSRAFYEEQLEIRIEDAALIPTEDLLARQSVLQADTTALERLLRRPFDLFEPPRLRAPVLPLDPATAGERIAALRREQLENDARLREAAEGFDAAAGLKLALGAGETLLGAGLQLEQNAFGLGDTSAAGLARRAGELDFQLTRLRLTLDSGLVRAGERASSALDLLAWPAILAGAEGEALRAEADALRPAALALQQQRDRLHRIRDRFVRMRMLAQVQAHDGGSAASITAMKELGASLANELGALRRAWENVPHPLAGMPASLGGQLVPEPPGVEDLQAIFDLGQKVLDETCATGGRVWGRLASITERLEQELALEPLPAPALPKPLKQAA